MEICQGCGDEYEYENDYGMGPPRGFCCNNCVGAFRSREIDKISKKYGLTPEQYSDMMREIDRLPSYGSR